MMKPSVLSLPPLVLVPETNPVIQATFGPTFTQQTVDKRLLKPASRWSKRGEK